MIAGEENSWTGEGEDFVELLRPREAMSSTKEGSAAIAGGEGGEVGQVPWATLGMRG